jgi:transcription termination/antitermination protein NusG
MNGPQVDRADQAAPESDEAATSSTPPESDDAIERAAEAFDEAAEREAEADEAIEDALEQAVTEAVVDAAAVEAVSDADIQEAFEERVAEAVESVLEGPELEAAVVQAGRDADVQEAIADAAIGEALEETIAETVVAASELEAASDAAIIEDLADQVGSIAAETEAAETEAAETQTQAEAPADVPEAEPEAAPKAPVAEEAQELEAPGGHDPFRGPGEWYVVHTYAGYENKVKTNLESRIHTMQMEDKIFDVHIPMEDVMEIKGGKKQVVQRKVFPGYLLVKMVYDNDSWYVVRNTPGVTGFVAAGTGSKPTPLSRREVEKILAVKKEEVKPQFRLGFEEGDVVRIISGPFADFNGTISEINLDQSKLKVLVNIFDRETPVELSFDQVAKV